MENDEVKTEELKTETPKKSNPLPIIVVVIALLVFGGVYLSKNKSQLNKSNDTKTVTTKEIKMDEVANHSTKDDCWLVIEGNVYDVTKFAPRHPGENAILLGCGKDATEMFNKRPNDGTSHSDRARNMLTGLQIGVLAK